MATILVVDDEEDIRAVVAITLEAYGHEVLQASDGSEALELMTTRPPDLVILDVVMRGIDGWTVLREMRRTGLKGSSRVLVLTARTREVDLLIGWKLGIDDYLTKPFDPSELVSHVNEVLFASASELEARRNDEIEKASLLSRVENLFDL